MYRNTRLRSVAALAAMVSLLFSQLAVAAYACPALLHSTAAEPVSQTADHGTDVVHDVDMCAEHDTARPGLCLAHCNPADLSLNHAQADAPPVTLIALYPLASVCEPALLAATAPQTAVPLRNHSPPHAVLHCCFRI